MTVRQDNDFLDLTKFALALLIVAIHSQLLPAVFFPVLRLAVPLFFMISAYLFFLRELQQESNETSVAHCWKFVLRSVKLYSFWLIVLLPYTLYFRRDWFVNGLWSGMLTFLLNIPLGSTFMASWFIPALMWGVVFVWWLGRRVSVGWMVFIAGVDYVFVSVTSSYLPKEACNLGGGMDWWCPYNSFPAAVPWVLAGRIAAGIPQVKLMRLRKPLFFVVLGALILLYIEWWHVGAVGRGWTNDSYLLLFPVAFPALLLLLGCHMTLSCAKTLRKLSVMIYAVHGSLVYMCFSAMKALGFGYATHPIPSYFFVLGSSLAVGFAILKIEKRWPVISYAH